MKDLIFINEEAIKRKSQATKFKYIHEAVEIFEQLIEDYGSHITNTKVIPCAIEEVNALELKLSPPFRLPTAYKEFLLYGGHRMAGLLGVLDIFDGMAQSCLRDPNEVYDLFNGTATTKITIITDGFGNLKNLFPGYLDSLDR